MDRRCCRWRARMLRGVHLPCAAAGHRRARDDVVDCGDQRSASLAQRRAMVLRRRRSFRDRRLDSSRERPPRTCAAGRAAEIQTRLRRRGDLSRAAAPLEREAIRRTAAHGIWIDRAVPRARAFPGARVALHQMDDRASQSIHDPRHVAHADPPFSRRGGGRSSSSTASTLRTTRGATRDFFCRHIRR